MKDPNDFMLAQSEGEQVKRLTAELTIAKAELALAKDALRIVRETSIEHAGKQNAAHAAELALRQTAEAYAARNALRVIALQDQAQQIQEARMVWAMGCDCLCNHCKGFDKLIRSFPQITNTVRPTELETACTCDSTLVTATSNHQPHCPRYVAETSAEQASYLKTRDCEHDWLLSDTQNWEMCQRCGASRLVDMSNRTHFKGFVKEPCQNCERPMNEHTLAEHACPTAKGEQT